MTASRIPDENAISETGWRSLVPGREILASERLSRGSMEAARDLIGCHMVSLVGGEATAGRIVETEAYLGRPDPASHAARRLGRTPRNDPMFGRPGTAYVYFIYGMHWCFNVVVAAEGDPQAVLIRALEPTHGLDTMSRRRGRTQDLTNGPARLCSALGVDGELNAHDLSGAPLLVLDGERPEADRVAVSGRVGIRLAKDWPLRFYLRDHPDVSPARAPVPASAEVLP